MEGLREVLQGPRWAVVVVGLGALAAVGLCLIGVVVLTGQEPAGMDGPEVTAVATVTAEATAAVGALTVPVSPAAPTAVPASTPGRVAARVVEVVDGDTIRVEIDGEAYAVRYIGIDAPEFGERMGAEATEANRVLVAGTTVYLETDVSETDQYGRLLRYVYLASGTFVNAELVRQGVAEAKAYPPDVGRQDLLEAMEVEARANGRGIWGAMATATVTSTPTPEPTGTLASTATLGPTAAPASPTAPAGGEARVVVDPACCQFDAPGDDNVNKEEEYVCFANLGNGDVDMSGWRVQDEYGWTYTFPAFVLPAGARVRVATGCGTDTDEMLFWCKDETAVWNNGGDTVFLYDAGGGLVATYSYGGD